MNQDTDRTVADSALPESKSPTPDPAEAPERVQVPPDAAHEEVADAPPEAATPAAEEPAAEEPAAEEPAAEEPAAEPPSANGEAAADAEEAEQEEEDLRRLLGDWYFVHTYAGYENKVKTNLETRISSMNMEDKIFEVHIPTEEVVEVKSGKKQTVERKLYPGYLLVRMEIDDDSWYVVRNTPGVTGFVGSGSKPVPLTRKEVDRIFKRKAAERPKPRLEWQVNDPVRVVTGPFANFQGVVSEIDVDRSKLKVLVNIFGRETPVELNFDQVSKV